MKNTLTRQQRRRLNREYNKRYMKASKTQDREDLVPNREININEDFITFPTIHVMPEENKLQFQVHMRETGETIKRWSEYLPPSIIFILVFNPQPFQNNQTVERASRTILSKHSHQNIILFIFSDNIDFIENNEVNKEKLSVLSDDLIRDYIKHNNELVSQNMDILIQRLKDSINERTS